MKTNPNQPDVTAEERLDRIRAICDQVEANPVGWGGDMAVSLARTIRAATTPSPESEAR